MEPTYAEVSEKLSDSPTLVGKVDGSSERGLATVFGITGFPTIYYIAPDNKSVYKYKGSRSADAMVDYVKGGYKSDEPLSFWTGPFGVVGSMKWGMLWLGGKAWGVYESLVPYLGQVGAGLAVGMGGIVAMSVGIVTVIIYTTPPPIKRD